MLNHNGALDLQNELQGDRKIIANVEKKIQTESIGNSILTYRNCFG